MRYVMIFLAVLVVLLLMIGFMFLVIRQVSDRVTGQVNGRYMRELSVFDRLYEEKKKKLEELEEQEKLYGVNLMKKEGAAENQPAKAAVEIPAASGLELPPSPESSPISVKPTGRSAVSSRSTGAQRCPGSSLWIRGRWRGPEKRQDGSSSIFLLIQPAASLL